MMGVNRFLMSEDVEDLRDLEMSITADQIRRLEKVAPILFGTVKTLLAYALRNTSQEQREIIERIAHRWKREAEILKGDML